MLCIQVKDTGICISKERIAAILTGLTQGDDPIAKRFGGLGIGFAMVRKISELLGGSIDVQSAMGSGTTVRFLVPVKPIDSADAEILEYTCRPDGSWAWASK